MQNYTTDNKTKVDVRYNMIQKITIIHFQFFYVQFFLVLSMKNPSTGWSKLSSFTKFLLVPKEMELK